MNADQVATLRALLASTGWLDRTSSFAQALRRSARTPNGLLVIGSPHADPWHITAHLAEESQLAEIPELQPTLVRWAPEPGAAPHLAVGLDRLKSVTRAETLLVVTPQAATAELLERVHDVRRAGAGVFALDADDPELDELAHESLPVSPATAPISFDAAQHLVTSAVGQDTAPGRYSIASATGAGASYGRRGGYADDQRPGTERSLRARLARLLDSVSGTADD